MDEPSKQLKARLEMAERALERSERLAVANRYSGAIMHEVNNPLEAITNLVYLTKSEKDRPAQVLEYMNIIEDQLKILGRITKQALTFHREHADASEFDLVEIAEAALKLHSDKLNRHGIQVERRFRGPAMVTVSGSQILQVVSNLILNAVDVLTRGKGRIWVSVKRCPQCVHMTVSDNGPGIPERYAKQLFEPYVTSKASGTGLGLWLSTRIITKHRGTLRFRTSRREGRSGTTFRIQLPTTSLQPSAGVQS